MQSKFGKEPLPGNVYWIMQQLAEMKKVPLSLLRVIWKWGRDGEDITSGDCRLVPQHVIDMVLKMKQYNRVRLGITALLEHVGTLLGLL